MRARAHRWLAGALMGILCALGWVPLAQAEPQDGRSRGGIVVVHEPSGTSSAARVQAELEALGWRVIALDDAGALLSELAADRSATAVLRVLPQTAGVELWIPPPDPDEPPIHETVRPTRRTDDVLALRAVEVLRARLLKLGVAPPLQERAEPPPPAPLPPPLPPPAPPPPPRREARTLAWVEWGATAGWGSQELGVSPTLRLGVASEPVRGWALGALVMPPLLSRSISGAEGSADARWGLVAVWTGWASPREHVIDVALGAGAGAVGLWVEGNARAPLLGRRDAVQSFTLFGRVGPGLRLAPSVHLRLEGLAGVALPEPVIAFAGREICSWGRPFVTISAQTEVQLARTRD